MRYALILFISLLSGCSFHIHNERYMNIIEQMLYPFDIQETSPCYSEGDVIYCSWNYSN